MRRLEHRVALVTGGLRGIGRAAVERLLAEGAYVVVADLPERADDDLAALGAAASYVRLDVGDEEAWRLAAARVERERGRLDILVANAGIGGLGKVRDLTLADWHRTMRVNLDGVFLATKYCTGMLARSGVDREGGASIVNVSSVMGLVGLPQAASYSASKGAVRLFTKASALEFAADRLPIRVNSLHPGFVATPLVAETSSDEAIAFYRAATPIGRLARPQEIAAAIAFLASDDASYMTGSELVVDGGYTAQ